MICCHFPLGFPRRLIQCSLIPTFHKDQFKLPSWLPKNLCLIILQSQSYKTKPAHSRRCSWTEGRANADEVEESLFFSAAFPDKHKKFTSDNFTSNSCWTNPTAVILNFPYDHSSPFWCYLCKTHVGQCSVHQNRFHPSIQWESRLSYAKSTRVPSSVP